MNRWPYRAETLVRRFERACFALSFSDGLPLEATDQLQRQYATARRDLLARIAPATAYQARHHD